MLHVPAAKARPVVAAEGGALVPVQGQRGYPRHVESLGWVGVQYMGTGGAPQQIVIGVSTTPIHPDTPPL